MLRVLTLSTLFPDATRPGFGLFVARQTQALAAVADTEVRVVAPIGVAPWPFRLAGRYRRLATVPPEDGWQGLPVLRPRFLVPPLTAGRWHARMLTRALVPVVDALRDTFAFDVIDASFFYPDGPAAVALGRRYGVPVSIKARGADIHHWGRAASTRAQVVAAGRAADGLLAVSAAMRADMASLGLAPGRIAVHHTGLDAARFRPIDPEAAKARYGVSGALVVSVGALIARKGHGIVIEAVARMPGVTLLIAGEGPERSALERRIAALGCGDRVRLLGTVPHDALPMLLGAADVMALASRSEGLANVWVEALACGTPIIVSGHGGADEVLTRPEAGTIAARTPDAFAAAIGAILAAPPPRDAVRGAVAGFSWAANGAALRAHLAALVAARQAPSG